MFVTVLERTLQLHRLVTTNLTQLGLYAEMSIPVKSADSPAGMTPSITILNSVVFGLSILKICMVSSVKFLTCNGELN